MQNPKKILYIWFAQLAFIIIDLNLQDIYILHFYTQLRPILILFWGKICFLWEPFYKTAIVVQVYSRKKDIFRGYWYDFIEFNFM